MIRVPVHTATRDYEVVVGAGAPPRAGTGAAFYGPTGRGRHPGRNPVERRARYRAPAVPDGPGRAAPSRWRRSKTLCRSFAAWGLTRGDVVVAVGGGVVTDTAGFAAASYHRGVAVVHVATTLLGMVDAAIGGKTGVNLPEGKNLVGAFWQPAAVVCDTEVLATLPPGELRSGRGEMAKYAFLGVDGLDGLPIDEAVAACVRCKAAVVGADERESPDADRGRMLLNYGHTLAHALESAGRYDLRHGEAVAIGLVYAAVLAARLGRIDDGPRRRASPCRRRATTSRARCRPVPTRTRCSS